VATGRSTSLLDLIEVLSDLAGNSTEVNFATPRTGDIVHSLADPSRMNRELGLKSETGLKDGLARLLESMD
ncbi:MAG: hypothetical protein KAS04_03855, partial [Candidatus Aenigmarchaeota archaeon]|nr:hypothetical protein [Candidatus Aenigmarchaeota archaeon]